MYQDAVCNKFYAIKAVIVKPFFFFYIFSFHAYMNLGLNY